MSRHGVVEGVSAAFCGVCASDPCRCDEVIHRAVAESCEDADQAEAAVRSACAAYLGERAVVN